MKCLDLFCKGGGAGGGYAQAGFDVTGVDIEPQPKFPFKFVQADAFDYLLNHGRQYDLVHASPPCQRYSQMTKTGGRPAEQYPDLIPQLRDLLEWNGKPYVIENVPGAPLKLAVLLCGTMFGLNIIRHRIFETYPMLWFSPAQCNHRKAVVKHGRRPDREKHYAAATGHFSDVEFVGKSMGIDWLGQEELREAIPPAYTHWIGTEMKKRIRTADPLTQ